jgi:TBC1 domain family member 10
MDHESDEDSDSPIGEMDMKHISIDKFGFIITPEDSCTGSISSSQQLTLIERKKLLEKESLRTKKWTKMLKDWDKTLTHKEQKLKSRIRKGIPDIVRGDVWKRIANVQMMKELYPTAFHDGDITKEIPDTTFRQIEVDLNRTFPRHDFFISCNGAGQASLRRLLQLYAVYDPEVGYCSGMGFVAATLVMYMSEEDALYAFISLMTRLPFPLREMYRPGVPGGRYTVAIFIDLTQHYLPALSTHLEREGITPHMYVTEWFMTLYTSSFPFELVTVILDILWYEGWKIIYRVGLGLLKVTDSFHFLTSCLSVSLCLSPPYSHSIWSLSSSRLTSKRFFFT